MTHFVARKDMGLTPSQQQAISARGNVLVMAGAGTGKTSTLVERCLNCMLEESPRASLDEFLVVTFTEAAAGEMRKRLRDRLEKQIEKIEAENGDPALLDHCQEQLALFETAFIGTLHSFCLQLIRQHFYELALDPQLSVLAEEEARLLAEETLDRMFEKYYAGRGSMAEAVQLLIQVQGQGQDLPIRLLILKLHHYTQTRPDPAGWFQHELDSFRSHQPSLWREWLLQAIADWSQRWLPALAEQGPANQIAVKASEILREIQSNAESPPLAVSLQQICDLPANCPRGKKTEWVKPIQDFFKEADFLTSLTAGSSASPDPLAEDWEWVRGQMSTLLELTREFTEAFTEAKRELGMVDFHDLEQYALRLLWDPQANAPTRTALHWRQQLRFVFVDEYQDINAAQDKIVEALSRDGAQANRFLVGDVKQSIYRFRLADPHIFQDYVRAWSAGAGVAIPLVDNFRSREGILNVTNSVFELVMREEVGGVPYDEQAKLRFGAPADRRALGVTGETVPSVELHLRLKSNTSQDREEEVSEAMSQVQDLEEADKEARLVALRLIELKTSQQPVWDDKAKAFRPVGWNDMAVLLRSPSGKAESYAKEFARLNIPLLVARGGFYDSLEISDLLSLLQVLDNPLQDIPVLAVLHSPLVGLNLDELADIRLAVSKANFWTALLRWHETAREKTETTAKVGAFLERFARWRRMVRQVSLSRCLESVLAETHYAAWLLTQPRGEQRHANVRRLVTLAQQFDQFQRQGLFRFLRFVEAQQLAATEPEVESVSAENAVRLMSIHQSKGLEFPVVVVADLAKPFNVSDLRAEIILDSVYGLCPQVKPPHTGRRYPSLPYWLARQLQHREMLGEELRLLYVAMTRARDRLILSTTLSEKKFSQLWAPVHTVSSAAVSSARCYSDWLALWFSRNSPAREENQTQGLAAGLSWTLHDDTELAQVPSAPAEKAASDSPFNADPAVWDQLKQRLAWQYPYPGATRQPAKTSVTTLRRQAAEIEEETEDLRLATSSSPPLAQTGTSGESGFSGRPKPRRKTQGLSATDIGLAHHAFLQYVELDHVDTLENLRVESQRLLRLGALSKEEVAALDFQSLLAFWQSEIGRLLLSQAAHLRRELPFTLRLNCADMARLTDEPEDPAMAGEFVVLQGVADLVVIRPKEIWLLDFKTDHLAPGELEAKTKTYEPQLNLYAHALSQIYSRPVTRRWLYFLSSHTAVAMG
jgi:ATP-dependent helicase/nuclease subunit A